MTRVATRTDWILVRFFRFHLKLVTFDMNVYLRLCDWSLLQMHVVFSVRYNLRPQKQLASKHVAFTRKLQDIV
jgi:hypothetical protein